MALTDKRRVFIAEYLKCWNATEAARCADYAHPGSDGHRLLKISEIQDAIQEQLQEKLMGADEAMLRMAQLARGEWGAYIEPSGEINIEQIIADGKAHLIKKVRLHKDGVEYEFYDMQRAIETILKLHGKFTSNIDVTSGGEPLHNLADIIAEIRRQDGREDSGA